jgi:hypothetical protein
MLGLIGIIAKTLILLSWDIFIVYTLIKSLCVDTKSTLSKFLSLKASKNQS